ncbi:MAG TPA: YdeI/OmpD-associated family protein [Solirubrobacterales bacterium]|nr:YdeI/OmpD-associated family protein [Solirubrobacterales bacterium]
MSVDDGLPQLSFASAAEWEAWLEANHDSSPGVWLKIAKKGSGIASVTISEALDACLCFGWIDGRREALDDRYYLQRYTPRRRRSKWSRINVEKVERLATAGRIRAAGLAEVERAKADGRWDAAYESPRRIAVPDDLRRELAARPEAREFFDGLDSRNRYAILYRLDDAKRPETRARRLERFVAMLEAREKLHP